MAGRGREKVLVEALVAGLQLESRAVNDDLVIDLPPLELFEVLTVTTQG